MGESGGKRRNRENVLENGRPALQLEGSAWKGVGSAGGRPVRPRLRVRLTPGLLGAASELTAPRRPGSAPSAAEFLRGRVQVSKRKAHGQGRVLTRRLVGGISRAFGEEPAVSCRRGTAVPLRCAPSLSSCPAVQQRGKRQLHDVLPGRGVQVFRNLHVFRYGAAFLTRLG